MCCSGRPVRASKNVLDRCTARVEYYERKSSLRGKSHAAPDSAVVARTRVESRPTRIRATPDRFQTYRCGQPDGRDGLGAGCAPTRYRNINITYVQRSARGRWGRTPFTIGRGQSTAACGRAAAARDTVCGRRPGTGAARPRRRA